MLHTESDVYLSREGTSGSKFLADEIAGGNVRDTEEGTEAAGVCTFSDAWAAKENPLDIPALGICSGREKIVRVSVGFHSNIGFRYES